MGSKSSKNNDGPSGYNTSEFSDSSLDPEPFQLTQLGAHHDQNDGDRTPRPIATGDTLVFANPDYPGEFITFLNAKPTQNFAYSPAVSAYRNHLGLGHPVSDGQYVTFSNTTPRNYVTLSKNHYFGSVPNVGQVDPHGGFKVEGNSVAFKISRDNDFIAFSNTKVVPGYARSQSVRSTKRKLGIRGRPVDRATYVAYGDVQDPGKLITFSESKKRKPRRHRRHAKKQAQ